MESEEIDNSACTLARLRGLYTDHDLSDIQLKVGHRVFPSHRLILSMSSDVFRTMLNGNTWPESTSSRIVLQEDTDCQDVFEDFLKYIYSGEIKLTDATVLPLLTLADKYNIPDLSRSCLQYMCTHCLPSAGGYIVAWLHYAIICGSRHLEHTCRHFIQNNFEWVMRTREFVLMSKDILLSFLDSSDLVVKDEFSLYRAVKLWLGTKQATSSENEFERLFTDVMSYVRFPMMQLCQLAALEDDSFVTNFKDFYLQKLFVAMRYHTTGTAVQSSQGRKLYRSRSSQYWPRYYTGETWSTTVTVGNLSSIGPGEVQGAFFSTPASCAEVNQHTTWDWHIDLYPRGVQFHRCILIRWQKNLVLEEETFRTVRVAVSTSCEDCRKVQVCILVISSQDGEEYVRSAVTRYAIFDKDKALVNINDIVKYEELDSVSSPCMVNPDTFKIIIVIKPATL